MTLEQAIITKFAASLLHLNAQGTKEITVPARNLPSGTGSPRSKRRAPASGVRGRAPARSGLRPASIRRSGPG
jgi:hypothetical protein